MPNPSGKNGWGEKIYPPNLKEILLVYAERGLRREEKISRLFRDTGLKVGKSKLNELERELKIPTVRRPRREPDEIESAVIEEMKNDFLQNNGPAFIKAKLKDRLIMVPRDKVRTIMLEHAPEGFDRRFPGRKYGKIKRQALKSAGPFREISANGHDKLNAQALRMGEISLGLYGYRDKWSGTILKLVVLPNSRSAAALGHVFLDLVNEIGIGVQLTTDKGSEVGWQYAFQGSFRDLCSPDIDPNTFPAVVSMKSTSNIVIESFWRWLKEKLGVNLKETILHGKNTYLFQSHSVLHRDLFYWIFVPVIQTEMNNFRTYWNQHRVRNQDAKLLPSGHVPVDALEHPEDFDGLNCFIPVTKDIQDEARQALIEEVGPRDQHLGWYDDDFANLANTVYNMVEAPAITLQSAWNVFALMSKKMLEIN